MECLIDECHQEMKRGSIKKHAQRKHKHSKEAKLTDGEHYRIVVTSSRDNDSSQDQIDTVQNQIATTERWIAVPQSNDSVSKK